MRMYVRPSPEQIESWIQSNISIYRTRESGKHGTIYLFDNPFVPGDHGFHVGVSPEKGWVKDFRPQHSLRSKSFIKFVSDVEKIPYAEAVKKLCGNGALIQEALKELKGDNDIADYAEPDPDFSLPRGFMDFGENVGSKGWEIATNYIKSRQVSIEEARELGVLYTPMSLCFVYFEYDTPVYWQIRYIADKRFVFPKGSNAEDFLYGYDDVEPFGDLFITEAIFDKIMLGSNCVATGGANIKPNQLNKIRMLNPQRIILAPDNDDAGLASLRYNFDLLDPYFVDKLYYVLPGEGKKDWNDMGRLMDRMSYPDRVLNWAKGRVQKLDNRALIKITTPVMRKINDHKRRKRY